MAASGSIIAELAACKPFKIRLIIVSQNILRIIIIKVPQQVSKIHLVSIRYQKNNRQFGYTKFRNLGKMSKSPACGQFGLLSISYFGQHLKFIFQTQCVH